MSNMYQAQAPVVVQTGPVVTVPTVRPQLVVVEHYSAKVSRGLGISQIVMGCCSLLAQIIAAVVLSFDYGSGIWCGVFFILAGAFGVAAGKSMKRSLITAHLVLSIIAAFLALIQLSISASVTAGLGYYVRFGSRFGLPYFLYLFLVFLALAEGIVAIIASAISCHGLCCGPSRAVPTHVHGQVSQTAYIQTPTGPQQIMVVSGPPMQQMPGNMSPYVQGTPQPYMQGIPQPYMQGTPQPYMQGTPQPYMQGTPQPYAQGNPQLQMPTPQAPPPYTEGVKADAPVQVVSDNPQNEYESLHR